MLKYKIDVLKELKKHGYNTTRILKEHIIAQSTTTDIRNNKIVGMKTLNTICELLDMQPGDIIEYVKEEEEENIE